MRGTRHHNELPASHHAAFSPLLVPLTWATALVYSNHPCIQTLKADLLIQSLNGQDVKYRAASLFLHKTLYPALIVTSVFVIPAQKKTGTPRDGGENAFDTVLRRHNDFDAPYRSFTCFTPAWIHRKCQGMNGKTPLYDMSITKRVRCAIFYLDNETPQNRSYYVQQYDIPITRLRYDIFIFRCITFYLYFNIRCPTD